MAEIGKLFSNVTDSIKDAVTNGFNDWKSGDTQNGLGAAIVGITALIAGVLGYKASGGFGQAGGSLFGIIPVVMIVGSLVGSIINQPIQSILDNIKGGDEKLQGQDVDLVQVPSQGQGQKQQSPAEDYSFAKIPINIGGITISGAGETPADVDGSKALSPDGAPIGTGNGTDLKVREF